MVQKLTPSQKRRLLQFLGLPVSDESAPTPTTHPSRAGGSNPIVPALAAEGVKQGIKQGAKAVIGSGGGSAAVSSGAGAVGSGGATVAGSGSAGTLGASGYGSGAPLASMELPAASQVGAPVAAPIGAYVGPAISLIAIGNGAYQMSKSTTPYDNEWVRKKKLFDKGLITEEQLGPAPTRETDADPNQRIKEKPWEANQDFASTRDVSKLKGGDVVTAATFTEWDPDWNKRTPEQQQQIAQKLLDAGLLGEGHGTPNINQRMSEGFRKAHPNDPHIAFLDKKWDSIDGDINAIRNPLAATGAPQTPQPTASGPNIESQRRQKNRRMDPNALPKPLGQPPSQGAPLPPPPGIVPTLPEPIQPALVSPTDYANAYMDAMENNMGYDLTNPLARRF